MTDTNYITVALEKGINEEQAEFIINAIKMIKGAMSAESNIADPVSYAAEQRVKIALEKKIWDALHSKPDNY